MYAPMGNVPWYNFSSPGSLRLVTDGILIPAQHVDTKSIYDANCTYKGTDNNIRHTVNAVLNRTVPNAYTITSTSAIIGEG